mmetsp:Transcript_24737/g.80921  ORF Transcript_24737/g.80921 Transcript_24737/m.80921 type:complete len:280 (-) Transcript_24737:25-864(-)
MPLACAGGVWGDARRVGRQRAAALGLAGQLRRLLRPAAAARQADGPRPPARRPPVARLPDRDWPLHLDGLALLHLDAVPPQRGDWDHRLRQAGGVGHHLPAQAHHRRHVCVLAPHRLRADAPDLRQGRGGPARRHGAHLRPRRSKGCAFPLRLRGRRHHHHAQVPPRTARRDDLLPEGRQGGRQEGEGDRVRARGPHQPGRLPGPPGRAAQPHHRRPRHRAQAGGRARVRRVPAAGAPQLGSVRRRDERTRLLSRLGRHGQPLAARRPQAVRHRLLDTS